MIVFYVSKGNQGNVRDLIYIENGRGRESEKASFRHKHRDRERATEQERESDRERVGKRRDRGSGRILRGNIGYCVVVCVDICKSVHIF